MKIYTGECFHINWRLQQGDIFCGEKLFPIGRKFLELPKQEEIILVMSRANVSCPVKHIFARKPGLPP